MSAEEADTEQSPAVGAGEATGAVVVGAQGVPAGSKNWREAMMTVGNPC